jgi:hypothetical protein
MAWAHGDCIADFEGHQVLTNLQRATIGFARSRHDIVNACPRNRVAGEKDQMRIGGQFRLGQRKHLTSFLGTSVVGDDALDVDI